MDANFVLPKRPSEYEKTRSNLSNRSRFSEKTGRSSVRIQVADSLHTTQPSPPLGEGPPSGGIPITEGIPIAENSPPLEGSSPRGSPPIGGIPQKTDLKEIKVSISPDRDTQESERGEDSDDRAPRKTLTNSSGGSSRNPTINSSQKELEARPDGSQLGGDSVEKFDLNSDPISNNSSVSKMDQVSVVSHSYSDPFSGSMGSHHPIVQVNLLEPEAIKPSDLNPEKGEADLLSSMEESQVGGANGDGSSDDEGDDGDGPEPVAAAGFGEAFFEEEGEDDYEDDDEDEEEEFEEEDAPFVFNMGDAPPQAAEEDVGEAYKMKPREDRPQIYDLNEEELAKELQRAINHVYRRQLTFEGRKDVLRSFLTLQNKAKSLATVDPNLPPHPMIVDYFNLNFSQPWLAPMLLDLKQVYIPDSQLEYGPRIQFKGGQGAVISKINDIIELRNAENNGQPSRELLENSNTLAEDIQFNYRPDVSLGHGVEGPIRGDRRYEVNYDRSRNILRYHPDFELLAAKEENGCLTKTPAEVLEMQKEQEIRKWSRMINFRQSYQSWIRHLNLHREGEDMDQNERRKSKMDTKNINRTIIGQKPNPAVEPENLNLVGFIRLPLVGPLNAYQLYVRDNPKVANHYKRWQQLDEEEKMKYVVMASEAAKKVRTDKKVYYFECIPEFKDEYLTSYPEQVVIYLFPRDDVEYQSIRTLTDRLKNKIKLKERGTFAHVFRRERIKLTDFKSKEDLLEFLEKHKLNLVAGVSDSFFEEYFQQLNKVRTYLEFLERIIPGTSEVIDIRAAQSPTFTSISSLDRLLNKFGLGLENLTEEDQKKLQTILRQNLKNVTFYKKQQPELRKIYRTLQEFYGGEGEEGVEEKVDRTVPDRILFDPEITQFYGKYPDRGALKDTDLNRAVWILSKVDNGNLYFAVAYYHRLLEQLNGIDLGVPGELAGPYLMVQQNLLEAFGASGLELTQEIWLGNEKVQAHLAKIDAEKTKLQVLAEEKQEQLDQWEADDEKSQQLEQCGARFGGVTGKLGIRLGSTATGDVIILEVLPSSKAITIGVKQRDEIYDNHFQEGDVILRINGADVDDVNDVEGLNQVQTLIESFPPGKKFKMRIRRGGEEYPLDVKTNSSKIRWAYGVEDEYDLNKICIWNGERFVPRLYYLVETQKNDLETQAATLDWLAKMIETLPLRLGQAYEIVEQSQVRYRILYKQNYKPRGVYAIDKYDVPSIIEADLVPEEYNPCIVALRQLEGVPNVAERNRRIGEVLDQRTELVKLPGPDGLSQFLRCKETGQYVCCLHKRDEIRMGREEFLEEYAENGTYCKYCKDQINVEEYDAFEGFDENDQPIRRDGTIIVHPGQKTLDNCQSAFLAVTNEVDWEYFREQAMKSDDLVEFEDELEVQDKAMGPGDLTEFQQWICYILDNLVARGLIYIRGVMGPIITNFLATIRDPERQLTNLINSNIEISDPRVENVYQDFLNNLEKLPTEYQKPLKQLSAMETKIASVEEQLTQMADGPKKEKMGVAIDKSKANLQNEINKFKNVKLIPIIKTQLFTDRYVYLISQVILQVRTKYPQFLEKDRAVATITKIKDITKEYLPIWLQEYEYKVDNREESYISAKKSFFRDLWETILYFNQQRQGVKLERHFNKKFKEEQEILYQDNQELLKKLEERWVEGLKVKDEPYNEQFFLTDEVLDQTAKTLNQINLQLKYVAQQIHVNFVTISNGITEGLKDDLLDVDEAESECHIDVREYWTTHLWNYFLKGEGYDLLAKVPTVFTIANDPKLSNAANELQQLQAQQAVLLKQREELYEQSKGSYDLNDDPNPYILNKTRLNLRPVPEAKETVEEVPRERFVFGDPFLDMLAELDRISNQVGIFDKRVTNLATYLAAYKWDMLTEGDKTWDNFQQLLGAEEQQLLGFAEMSRKREKEIEETIGQKVPEDEQDEAIAVAKVNAIEQEINLIKKYIISYFRYYIARFAFNDPQEVLEMPEIREFFEKKTDSPNEVDPDEAYDSKTFQRIVNLSKWLNNEQIQKIVNYLRDKACYPAYKLNIGPKEVRHILYYVMYLDLYQNLKSLGGEAGIGSVENLETYEDEDPLITLNTVGEIRTFINDNMLIANKDPLVVTDFTDRLMDMIRSNWLLAYLTDGEMFDLRNRKIESKKRRVKRNDLTREWARLRVPWAIGDEEAEEVEIEEGPKEPAFEHGDQPENYLGEDEGFDDEARMEAQAQGFE